MKRCMAIILAAAMSLTLFSAAAFAERGTVNFTVSPARVELSEDGTGSFTIEVTPPEGYSYSGVQYQVMAPVSVEITSVTHSPELSVVMAPQITVANQQDPNRRYNNYMFGSASTSEDIINGKVSCAVNVKYTGDQEQLAAIVEIRMPYKYTRKVQQYDSDGNPTTTRDVLTYEYDKSAYARTSVALAPNGGGDPADPSPEITKPPVADQTASPPGATNSRPGGNNGGGNSSVSSPSPTPAPNGDGDGSTDSSTGAQSPTLINERLTPLGVAFSKDHLQYISGYPDGTVRPDANITRAEVVSILHRLIDDPDKNDPMESAFFDAPPDQWYAQSVAYAAKKGIVLGYPEGDFRPDANITRAEFATIMSRFIAAQSSASAPFFDVPSDHWAADYIAVCSANGWVNGYPDGGFHPENNITRAETVTVLNRSLGRGAPLSGIPSDVMEFADLPADHWAYAQIIEASVAHEYSRDANGDEVWK